MLPGPAPLLFVLIGLLGLISSVLTFMDGKKLWGIILANIAGPVLLLDLLEYGFFK